ncbi:MAG: serine/threonine protein kinase [Bryobacteraceae bacterium]|nr:serine/threonine protein kinase [Bryobacteraceae bacterium]
MSFLPDPALRRLRDAFDAPDLSDSRYTLLEPIGRGGMGAVYAVHDAALDRRVALKVIDAGAHAESRIVARLEHPGIVPVHDSGTLPDGRPYYVMKLVEGEPLHRVPLEMPEALRVFLRVCDAIAFAHSRGIVHRDLKPENIMIGRFGEVLVLDWGVAAEAHAGAPRAGTPGFQAPEPEVTAASDIYSLGMLLRELVPEPRPPLRSIIERATQQRPEARYESAADLARDVTAFLDGTRVQAHRESLGEAAARLARKHQLWIVLIATYLVLRTILFFWFRR